MEAQVRAELNSLRRGCNLLEKYPSMVAYRGRARELGQLSESVQSAAPNGLLETTPGQLRCVSERTLTYFVRS